MPNYSIGHRGVGHWLPRDHKHIKRWLKRTIKAVEDNPSPFLPIIQKFQEFIEGDTVLYMLFSNMFDEIPNKPPYDKDPVGNKQVRDYKHMLAIFNYIIQNAPAWSEAANEAGLIGFPINAVLDWPMGTSSGYAAFLDPRVNDMFKQMFDVWSAYLSTPASVTVLDPDNNGWLGPEGLAALTEKGDDGVVGGPSFPELYQCNPSLPYWGFTSWDNFFTRVFNDDMRPISDPEDNTVIVNACESAPYALVTDISLRDKFWIKSQQYSLQDMLASDPLTSNYVGGSIYQAFLSALSYHRWHRPITGKIVNAYHIPGTYYSEPPSEGFPSGHPDPSAPNNSQRYITAVAARAIIFIESDNTDLGTVCFLAVGMAEVSTCEITVQIGDTVTKGQEIGMFHFGGSTHCLIFEKGVQLAWEQYCYPSGEDVPNIPLAKKIATVGPRIAKN